MSTPASAPLVLILFSQSDPFGGQFAEFALRREGLDVYQAKDVAALEAQVDGHAPALVVLDVMASGGSGLGVIHRLSSRLGPTTLILAVSVLSDGDAALAAGAAAFMQKPLDPLEFVATVKRVIRDNTGLRR